MHDLSDRRILLLKAIVEEFVRTAEPVGSKNLVKRYKLRVSPATVRNEMAVLVENGFLNQPHASAGRTPAPMGLRYYIRTLMNEESLPVLEEVALKQRLMECSENHALLAKEAVTLLAQKTNLAATVVMSDGLVLTSGAVHLLDNPEFYDIDVTRSVLTALDTAAIMQEIFSRVPEGREVSVLIGDEIELANFENIAVVFSHFSTPNHSGTVAVVGPYRLRYPVILPTVRYFGNLLAELLM